MSLLELMAALAILGLLVAIVPPALDGVSATWRLRAAGRDIESTVRSALNEAAATGRPARVLYDLREQGLWVRSGDERRSEHRLPKDIRFRHVRFGNISVVYDVAAVRAFPDGTLDAHEVSLSGPDGLALTIGFDRLTGEPRFAEGADAADR